LPEPGGAKSEVIAVKFRKVLGAGMFGSARGDCLAGPKVCGVLRVAAAREAKPGGINGGIEGFVKGSIEGSTRGFIEGCIEEDIGRAIGWIIEGTIEGAIEGVIGGAIGGGIEGGIKGGIEGGIEGAIQGALIGNSRICFSFTGIVVPSGTFLSGATQGDRWYTTKSVMNASGINKSFEQSSQMRAHSPL
jgi:hypothetical protein